MSTEQGTEIKSEVSSPGRDDVPGPSEESKEPTSPTVNKLKGSCLYTGQHEVTLISLVFAIYFYCHYTFNFLFLSWLSLNCKPMWH